MTLSERLKERMQTLGLSQGELARRVGVAQGSIYKLVSGNAKSSKKIVEIAQALGVTAEWLISGSGSMYGNANASSSDFGAGGEGAKLWGENGSLSEIELPYIADLESAFENETFPFDTYDGSTMRFEKSDLQGLGVNTEGEGLLIVGITGDGMEPVLTSGSRIGIDLNDKRIVDGKTYAINQSGWKRVRLLYRTGPDEITLRSYSPEKYPDERVNLSSVEILGRVFYAMREM